MRTIRQIKTKVRVLQIRLDNKPVVENFGEREQNQLNDYIGDVYKYSYDNRLAINTITQSFFKWCCNYC